MVWGVDDSSPSCQHQTLLFLSGLSPQCLSEFVLKGKTEKKNAMRRSHNINKRKECVNKNALFYRFAEKHYSIFFILWENTVFDLKRGYLGSLVPLFPTHPSAVCLSEATWWSISEHKPDYTRRKMQFCILVTLPHSKFGYYNFNIPN